METDKRYGQCATTSFGVAHCQDFCKAQRLGAQRFMVVNYELHIVFVESIAGGSEWGSSH